MTAPGIGLGVIAGTIGLLAWLWLVLLRDGFWLMRARDEVVAPPQSWPAVTAIVPARDEAAVIGPVVAALAAQDYPGRFRLILVDDASSDGTARIAKQAAGEGRIEILTARALPAGWTGKLWALEHGVQRETSARFLWFTDADIVHAPDTLRMLVARAVRDKLVLHSLMAELRCESVAERALIPAFVFFFAMLYPFEAVNRPGRRIAAAAGGCMLVDRAALSRAGGLAAIAAALIDDCALGRALKAQGRIRLALTHRSRSIRPYPHWRDVGAMVARSAYAQLGYAPLLLAGTLAGLGLVYLAPPLLAFCGHGMTRWLGVAAWLLMALAFQPMLRFYRRSPLWGVTLPAIAMFYAGATCISALRHRQGRGGTWKGRVQAGLRV